MPWRFDPRVAPNAADAEGFQAGDERILPRGPLPGGRPLVVGEDSAALQGLAGGGRPFVVLPERLCLAAHDGPALPEGPLHKRPSPLEGGRFISVAVACHITLGILVPSAPCALLLTPSVHWRKAAEFSKSTAQIGRGNKAPFVETERIGPSRPGHSHAGSALSRARFNFGRSLVAERRPSSLEATPSPAVSAELANNRVIGN